ncbi:MAG: carboxypeptidase-like regulatory domain-containing protein [Pseudolysinimonas sp.]
MTSAIAPRPVRRVRTIAALLAVIALAIGGALATPLTAIASGASSISGTVTGSDAPGVGLADVGVTLTLPGGTFVAYATTDADGHYSFDNVVAASYTVSFEPDFNSPYLVELQWWNGAATAASATPIVVADHEAVAGIDAILPLAGAITGTVTSDSGPLFGANVSAIEQGGGVVAFAPVGFDGTFTLRNLHAGSYTVAYAGGVSGTIAPQWWSGAATLADATYFPVALGETATGKDAILEPATGATTGSISGTITNASSGQPQGGGFVTVVTPDGTPTTSAGIESDGTYTISGVTPGSVALHVFPAFSDNLLDQWWSGASTQADAQYITVEAGSQLTGYDFALVPGASISGTVTDASHAPLANVSVSALRSGDFYAVSSFTDDDGHFTIPALRAGDFTVSFDPSSAGAYAMSWWNGASTPSNATVIHVAEGQAITGINATLGAGASISGTVTGLASNGAVFPATNATVYLIRPDGSEATETYAGDGSYTLSNLAPGKYTLRFEPQGDTTDFVPQWLGNKSSQATAKTITVKAGKSLTGVDLTMPSTTLASATPTITGNAIVGRTLHAHAGTWGPSPVTLSYQWSQNGNPIGGATASSYVVSEADAASTLTVAVTGSKEGYHSTTTVSAPTAIVTGGTLTTSTPTISGVGHVGNTLTVEPGVWAPSPTLTFQWYRGATAIAGATGASYVVAASDANSNLRVAVTGTQIGYTTATVKSGTTHIPR